MPTSSSSSGSRRRCGRARSIRSAISTGYRRGFHTIIDANVVTLIAAGVLYVSSTSSVKGFALMLLIGVITSIFTAVVATRAMLGVLSGFSFMSSPRVLGAVGTRRSLEALRLHRPPPHLVRRLGRRDRGRRDQPGHQGAQPGHRLHRRQPARLPDHQGAHDRPDDQHRVAVHRLRHGHPRGRRRPRHQRQHVHPLPGAVALPRPAHEQGSCRRRSSRTPAPSPARSACATSRRRSGSRCCTPPTWRSPSRC